LVLASQAASPPALAAHQSRPPFQVLRFNEKWGALGDSIRPLPFDQLKFIALGQSGLAFLSVGGQARERVEGTRGYLLGGAGTREDVFVLSRVMLHADFHLGDHLRFFAEGKHATAYGRELPGARRPLDYDEFDVQNLFAEVAVRSPVGKLNTRVGRQELMLGRQRLVSPLDWANSRRTFDGARVELTSRAVVVEAFYTEPVAVRSIQPNRRDRSTAFYGFAAGNSTGRPFTLQAYALALRQTEGSFAGLAGAHRRFTVGSRVAAGSADRAVRADLEGGIQFGELADQSVRAWFVASDIAHRFTTVRTQPTLTLGFDWASGDSDRADTKSGTFHQLFPLAHAYAGYADVLGRQNLAEGRLVLESQIRPGWRGRLSAHRFARASTTDAVYGAGGSVFDAVPVGRDQRHIGDEIDATTSFDLNRQMRVELGFARFAPGALLLARPDGAEPMVWVYTAATFTF
jgi:hypothetical protein